MKRIDKRAKPRRRGREGGRVSAETREKEGRKGGKNVPMKRIGR